MGAACCGEPQPTPKKRVEKKPIPKRKETDETMSPNRRGYLYDYSKEPLW